MLPIHPHNMEAWSEEIHHLAAVIANMSDTEFNLYHQAVYTFGQSEYGKLMWLYLYNRRHESILISKN